MQGSAKMKELMRFVHHHNVEKINILIRKGVELNFCDSSSGETPLTLAVENDNTEQMRVCSSSPIITALVAGGAHMDFRNQRGLTPLHVAVKTHNVCALKTLLDLGVLADVFDSSGLTPLYHCCLSDQGIDCINPLIQAGARLDCTNSQNWTMLHQVCRYGRLSHLKVIMELLMSTKNDKIILNAQNDSGNTALHVCALNNQERCLVTLLKHGVETEIRNYAHQDAFQVAVLARNVRLATVIKDYPHLNDHEMASWIQRLDSDPPSIVSTNDNCPRHSVKASPVNKIHRAFSLRRNPFSKDKQLSLKQSKNSTTASRLRRSKSIHANFQDIYEPPDPEQTETPVDRNRLSSSSSDGGVLYVIGCDYQATTSDHLSVKAGDAVADTRGVFSRETCNIKTTVPSFDPCEAPEGFCKAKIGRRVGFIPLNLIKAVKSASSRPTQRTSCSDWSQDKASDKNSDKLSLKSFYSGDSESSDITSNDAMINEVFDVTLQATSHPNIFHRRRDVTLYRTAEGYGFVLKGAKSDTVVRSFSATARQPGLQYFESVEVDGTAFRAGLRNGDFILKINSTNVVSLGHKQTVEIIRKSKDPIHMEVVTVVERGRKPSENNSMRSASSMSDVSITSSFGLRSSSPQLHRSGSIRSAIGKLDGILAVEDSDDNLDELTATLRRRPTNRRVRSPELQDIFIRHEQPSRPHHQEAQTYSAATGRRLLHVVPPALPHNSSVVVDEIAHNGLTHPSKTLGRSNTFTANVSATSRSPVFPATLSSSYGTPESFDSVSVSSSSPKKGAPPPPTRKTSRLTAGPQAPPSSFHAPSATPMSLSFRSPQDTSQTQNSHKMSPQAHHPPRLPSPSVTHSHGRGINGSSGGPDLSGIAAAVAVQAQQRQRRLSSSDSSDYGHNLSTKSPSSVSRQSDKKSNPHTAVPVNENESSALSIALAAKQASLKQRSQTVPQVQNKFNGTNSQPTREEMRELMYNLPPPPPPNVHNLPPPPPMTSKSDHNSTFNQMVLPPPPDIMLSSTIPPPPTTFSNSTKAAKSSSVTLSPARFKDQHTPSPSNRNSVSSNGLDAVSIADSGVDDVGTNSRNSHETLSVVSSLSTLSSEEGSDVGVSLSFDPKSNSEHSVGNSYLDNLKKTKTSPQNIDNKMMLTKVNFISSKSLPSSFDGSKAINASATSTFGNHKPVRVDVTKQNPVPKATKVEQATTGTKSDYEHKPLVEWNVDDVCKWLSDLGLGVHAQIFEENEIVGSHLPDLGKDDLQELGVTRVGHRLTIEKSLKKLTGK